MIEPRASDIDKHGGWQGVTSPGGVNRNFYVYELDRAEALRFIEAHPEVTEGENIEFVGPVNIHALIGTQMTPDDVKQHS